MTSKRIAAAIVALIGAGVGGIAAGVGGTGPAGGENVSIRSIRGIEGIDTVALQNLEAVLRIQSRAPTADSQTAANLVTMGSTELGEGDGPSDARQQLSADLEGS